MLALSLILPIMPERRPSPGHEHATPPTPQLFVPLCSWLSADAGHPDTQMAPEILGAPQDEGCHGASMPGQSLEACGCVQGQGAAFILNA